MLKRVLSVITVIALFFCCFAVPASADVTENKCGDNLYWYIDEETLILHIEGSGAMYDYNTFDDVEAPWYTKRNKILGIVLNDGITHIGTEAFWKMKNIESLIIPASVESIGEFAFYRCKNLTDLTFETGALNCIGDSAFKQCENLKNLILPENESLVIDYDAFKDTAIEELIIPCKNVSIGTFAFSQDNSVLSSVTILGDVEYIGTHAFWGYDNSPLKTVNIKGKVKEIDNCAFVGNCNLTEITIDKGVDTVGKSAFGSCTSLEKITFNSFVKLDNTAFTYCKNLKALVFREDAEITGEYYYYHPTQWLSDSKDLTVYCNAGANIISVCEYHNIPYKLIGDINGDNSVNILDIASIIGAFLKGEELDTVTADINGDGSIDTRDIIRLKAFIAEALMFE